ncbi:MAG TPA: choice-of-anchor B family protein [Saprospiraceae bacterium]|nr:choice-of-anchor B family protein [Saprospiraceae bacterium]HPI05347.1 choice-of-anchor B family protein [Saprospiraceae bacterium]
MKSPFARTILQVVLLVLSLFKSLSGNAQVLPPQFNLTPIGHLSYAPLSLAGCWHHVDQNGGEWALVGTSAGLSIVDLSDPTNPVQRFAVPGPTSNWRELRTWNGYAYVGSEGDSSGITIVNLHNLPDSITWRVWRGDGAFEGQLRRSHTVQTKDGYLYVFGGGNVTSGAIIASLTDPWNPVIVGRYLDNYVHDGFIRGDTLWTSEIYNGWFGVVDISDRSNPVLLATHPTPTLFNHNSELSPDGKTLFTTDEKPNAPLAAFDVSDLENISLIDTYRPGRIPVGEVHNVRVKGNFLVNPSYRGQLTIVDATYPDNLIETAWDSLGNSLVWDADPYLPSGLLFATAKSEGLFVYQPVYHSATWLEGTVTDIVTGFPLSDALVSLVGSPNNDMSDAEGIYKTGSATPGSYSVIVQRGGYAPAFLSGIVLVTGQVTQLDIQLTPEVTSTQSPDKETDIRVYPTLFSNSLEINITPESPFAQPGTLVRIADARGAVVLESKMNGNALSLHDLSRLPAGPYYLTLWNGAVASAALQVIKQH